MTFEEYLRKVMELGFDGFHLTAIESKGDMSFTIQPMQARGVVRKFAINSNELSEITQPTADN
jgi:hypothetical protein